MQRAVTIVLAAALLVTGVAASPAQGETREPDAAPGPGNIIVFSLQSDRGEFSTFVMRPDGTGRRQLSEHGPGALAPDGRTAAISHPDGIYLLDLDTGRQTRATHAAGDTRPAWAPDSRRFLFLRQGEGDGDTLELWIYDGEEPRFLVPALAGSWSPDGRSIAFCSSDGSVYRIPATGGAALPIGTGLDPVWSPGGAWLAAANAGRIELLNADGGGQKLLLEEEPGADFRALQPAWSPDGSRIVFTGIRDGVWDLYVMEKDGSDLTQITSTFERELLPGWGARAEPPQVEPAATAPTPTPTPLPSDTPETPLTPTPAAAPETTPAGSAIPPGWTEFRQDGVALWLPPSYFGAGTGPNLDRVVETVRALGPEFEGLAALIEANPDAYLLWAFDSNFGTSGFLTNVNVTTEQLPSDVSLEAYLDTVDRQLPDSIQVLERDIVPLTGTRAGRLVLQWSVQEAPIKQVAYVVKAGLTIYSVTYSTAASEFDERLPVFEQSIRTFRTGT